ncbi:hypothetical protein K432DRAFT_428177 [Lepidopterella palustris CBS 459.81]|uniref:non-specific serine/threonine protein kinase n=1 Tax=Lepidopterella palustris CBS 459.81 TaxID=1314670 RepID=A0A8E2E4U0_9PEZI|nr:hypothetical protein K432DRAFT_428177 [Lepidopterella palustris CBS 459.81]
MPRRRPPGAGPGLSTTLIAILLVLPWIATAAQQQQPPSNAYRRSPREEALADTVTSQRHSNLEQERLENQRKRSRHTPLISQNERAIATLSSAPAASIAAVRAPPAGSAASPSGGLSSRRSARSLQDWEVENFVLLATVDGHIHARDRRTGQEIWDLDAGRPMVETIYHQKNDSADDNNSQDTPFMWIVEPTENGNLFVMTPGPYPVLENLGLTIKQLAEELSPYSSKEQSVVYTAEKKNIMYVLDARTGTVLKRFSSGGSTVVNAASCEPQVTGFAEAMHRDECKGIFSLGQTEYIISIQNEITGEDICTIKYFEWTPNNRDRDLHVQYSSTMDNKYVYSKYDGTIFALDHSTDGEIHSQRPVYRRKFSSPVVRVFDVARYHDDDAAEPALVVLPQPRPGLSEDDAQDVWMNCTETGSWYVMSESRYPAVTDGAAKALCYSSEWSAEMLAWGGHHYLPEKAGLVGVHSINHDDERRADVPTISAPIDEPRTFEEIQPAAPPDPFYHTIETRVKNAWWPYVITVLAIILGVGSYSWAKPSSFDLMGESFNQDKPSLQAIPAAKPEASLLSEEPALETEERKVRFAIPEEEDEQEMDALSRTSTIEQPSAEANGTTPEEDPQQASNDGEGETVVDPAYAMEPPKSKKKAHRGQRGGRKKKKVLKEEDDVDRAVKAAKNLDQAPSLHPDEVTVNGDEIQSISSIKKIGKLTIDFDHVLGNGSGGTFVFGGKWNERDVAVKRMLPQYFGLAEQEVKLLQESDLHPNVIRYFDDEKDEHFLYIAVELCQASLWDLYRDGRPGEDITEDQVRLVNEINSDIPRALYQLALGLNHLHSLRIIHRDIKPQNILIAYPQKNQKNIPRLVISDFGLCKTLPDNVSTLIGTTGNAGTVGWKAPELILQPKELEARQSSTGHSRDSSNSTDPVSQGVKRAVDIFSLGCVFFYVLTNGCHPFDDDEGWMQIRELNIKKNKANFSRLNLGDDSEEPIQLISWMLENKPEDRPTALQVMNHPFFWPAEKRLNFLCDCSDHWEREPRDPPSDALNILEDFSWDVLDKKRDFLGKLDRKFIESLGKQRKYTGDRMLDLLRALRNKKNHYEDMDESVKLKVGPLPGGYLRYWTSRFPKLLMACYMAVGQCNLQGEPRFRPYFEGGIVR